MTCLIFFHKRTFQDHSRHKSVLLMLILTPFDELLARDLKLKCGNYYDTKHTNRGTTFHWITWHFQMEITSCFWNIFEPVNYKWNKINKYEIKDIHPSPWTTLTGCFIFLMFFSDHIFWSTSILCKPILLSKTV